MYIYYECVLGHFEPCNKKKNIICKKNFNCVFNRQKLYIKKDNIIERSASEQYINY